MIVIRGPGHTGHNISMAFVGKQRLATSCVPDLYGLVHACRGEALPIGRPGHTGHNISMTLIDIRKGYRR